MASNAERLTAPATIRQPAGWRIVAAKELGDHLRSVRLLIIAVLLLLAAMAAVYSAAGGIRDVAERATGTPAVFLRLFTIDHERLPSFISAIGLLAPLLGIAFGFDAVNGERAQGTLPRLVSQPIYRDDVINGKFVAGLAAIGMVLGAVMLFVGSVGLLRIGVVPSWGQVVRLVVYFAVSLVYVAFWLGLSILCSVWLRRAATSALAAVASWLVLTLFWALLVGIVADAVAGLPPQPTLEEQLRNARTELMVSRASPTTLYGEATSVLLNPQARSVGFILPWQVDRAVPNELPLTQSLLLVWPQTTWLVLLTVLTFGAAYVAFMRQEIRA